MNLIKKINQILDQNNYIQKGDKLLVGVSGGPDSVALLSVLETLKAKRNFTIAVAHFNHALRPEADQDEKFVQNLAKQYSLKFYSDKKDVLAYAKKNKFSLEEAARICRYNFFDAILKEESYHKLVLAHNSDDQIETFLMRIFAGTGLKGLEGILDIRNFIIRPFLSIPKVEILDFLKKRNLDFKIDKSNLNTRFPRNLIRQKIVPLIRKEYKNFDNNILRLVAIIKEENSFFDDIIQKFIDKSVDVDLNRVVICWPDLQELHPAVQSRVLHALLGNPSFYKIKTIQDFLKSEKKINKILLQEEEFIVLKEGNNLIFTKKIDSVPEFFYELSGTTGELFLREINCFVKWNVVHKKNIADIREQKKMYLDYDRIAAPLIIRNRREGDVVGDKKLKSLMINKKIPRWMRSDVPLFLYENKIISIFFNIAKKENFNYITKNFSVSPDTQNVLKIEFLRKNV